MSNKLRYIPDFSAVVLNAMLASTKDVLQVQTLSIDEKGHGLMACWYEWADDRHIVLNAYIEAPWTWEEYNKLTEEMFAMLAKMGTPCATAVNVNKMGRLPKGNALSHLTRMEKLMPDNVFASAVVGAPYMATAFMDILMRVRPRARRLALFTATMEEAYDKIMKRYEELQALSGKQQD